jgi:outer membrane lipoprotein-sorting protein
MLTARRSISMKRRLTRHLPALIAAAALMGLHPGSAGAQAGKRDPKVQALFDQMIAAYRALPAFQEKISFKYAIDAEGLIRDPLPTVIDVKAQKPNKLNISYTEKSPEGKMVQHQIVSDGANLWAWHSDSNTYTKVKAPSNFTQIDLPLVLGSPEFDVYFRGADPFQRLQLPANLLTVGAPGKIGEIATDLVEGKLAQAGVPITATFKLQFGQKDHFVRSVLFEGGGRGLVNTKPISFRLEAVYDLINPAPTFTAADFTFTPPAGAKQEQARPPAPKFGDKPGG